MAGLLGKLVDVLVGLEALGLAQHVVNGLASALHVLHAKVVREAAGRRGGQLVLHVDLVGEAKEEEVHQAGHVGLAALVLDHAHHLVVGRGMELDQNLAHHAHARLAAVVDQRQLVEGVDGVLAQLVEALAASLAQLHPGARHEGVMQLVGRAGHGLVGTGAVQALHHDVAVQQSPHGLDQQAGVGQRLEAGVVLVQAHGGGERDHGDVAVAGVLERLADEGDVVGCAAAAARLADEHGRARKVVLAAEDGLHELARDQDGGVADVVVHVLQARVHGLVVHGR